jgi:hypothetical protein
MKPDTVLTASRNDRFQAFICLFACMLFLYCAGPSQAEAGETAEDLINCSFEQGPCHLSISDQDIRFDITPKPVQAMSELRFTITLPEGLDLDDTGFYLDLDMPGMKMGNNQVHMKEISKGLYEGTGTIVRCPSGRKIWRATAIIPKLEKIQFIFKVN